MSARPYRGCQHVGAITYTTHVARCETCKATWNRSSDGPWRCVDPGADPSTATSFVCEGCGAGYREQPRSCLACGRPAGAGWEREPGAWSRVALETPAGKLRELATAVHVKQASIRRKRAELGLGAGDRLLPPLDDPDGGMRAD